MYLANDVFMAENRSTSESFIVFQLGDTSYGLRSTLVQQLEMIEQMTTVPNAPSFVDGVVFSRGQVIPAINLRARFGFEKKPHDLRTRLIVINIEGRAVGLVVDTAREFVMIPMDAIQPPHQAISGLSGKYLEGIATLGERLILILDLKEMLTLEEVALLSPESA